MVGISESHGALRREHINSARAGPEPVAPAEVPILVDQPRIMTEDDYPWLHYLCKKRYSHKYDSDTTAAWFKNVVLKSPLMFFAARTQDAFAITLISVTPWLPTSIEANLVFICADDGCMWQSIRLLRSSIDWARRRGCSLWRMSSDTDYDLAPLARRLGAEELSPRFVLRLQS
jgi:hypothetical protein